MSGHEATVLSAGRHGSWVECRCGWLSPMYRFKASASVAWALHMAERIGRRAS